MKKIKKYFTILIVFIISLFISNLLVTEVFIGNSPTVRDNLGEYIALKFQTKSFELAALNPFQSKNPQQLSNDEATKRVNDVEAKLANIPFQTVAKGVQAKSNGEVNLKTIDTSQVDKVTYNFTLSDGRKISISVMKDLVDKYGWTEADIRRMAN